MDVKEAVEAVCRWLCQQDVMLRAQGHKLAENHIRIAVQIVEPEEKRRVFDIIPGELPYCWECKEINSAYNIA